MTEEEKEARRQKRIEGIKGIGRVLVGAGLPALGMAVGGPMGATVASNVVKGLGLAPEATAADVEAALAENPEALARIREWEARLVIAQTESLNVEQVEVTKRHQADMSSDSALSKNIRPALLAFLTVAFVGYIYAVTFLMDKESIGATQIFAVQLAGVLIPAIGFYFPLRSSEKKAEKRLGAQASGLPLSIWGDNK